MTQIIDILQNLHDTHGDEIETWFIRQRGIASPYFYTSVDLRHSGTRLVPVDTNLYPAGFNNLSHAARERASRYTINYLAEHYPDTKKILIIPENHTRNLGYLENLAVLADILEQAGCEVTIGSLNLQEILSLTTLSGREITEHPLIKHHDRLITQQGFDADIIILNNDLTSGLHHLLHDLSQPILPPPNMGWHRRKKSVHFATYQKLAIDFASYFDIDPWLISANFHQCGMVDFKDASTLQCLAKAIDELIIGTRKKYDEYGIKDDPYIYIKADSGTYGMGIMTVKSGAEVLELNKKARNKMQVIKEGTKVNDVIIQEGIPTIDRVNNHPAEPMIYMIDGLPVGGMYRSNESRDQHTNLNATGMQFVGMCDEQETSDPKRKSVRECDFRAYGLIAAIASLASAQENYDIEPKEIAL